MKNSEAEVVQRRLIANSQSKGNMGKSTMVETVVAYYDSNSIPWKGSDTDSRHGTFSYRHPTQVKQYSMEGTDDAKGAFANILRHFLTDDEPVHIIDCAAQSDASFVAAIEQLNLFGLCAKHGIRMTLMLFPTDEFESMQNFANLVEFAEDEVDYLVVHNPAKSRGDLYKGSALESALVELGANSIVMPKMLPDTFLAMERAEAIAKRGITFAELAIPGNLHMDPILMGDLQWTLNNVFAQYESVADFLLPTKLAAAIKERRTKPTNRPKIRSPKLGLNFGN